MGLRRSEVSPAPFVALIGAGLCTLLAAGSASAQCVGDCNGNGSVGISELITGINISLNRADVSICEAFDCRHDGMVGISCLVQGVNNSLAGSCPTPTVTPATPCPLEPGRYTSTQTTGGSLRVGSLSTFPFPSGGTVIQDVKPGNAQCIHDTIVPFPDGFFAPFFCIPGLGFTVKVTQTGCGVGQIASNGAADYTVTEVGDSSDTNGPCNLPHRNCAGGADADLRLDVTVGDGTPDSCTSGAANAIVAIPVETLTWLEHSSGDCCGNLCNESTAVADGTFDPGAVEPDLEITRFPQILDFTTDRSTAKWADLDGDGCSLAGAGPASGFDADPHSTGVCLDLDNNTITTVASGPVGSTGSPLFDLTYLTFLPNQFSGPEAPLNATCDSPPAINFAGTASRCVNAQ
jgi:hypothetical protein